MLEVGILMAVLGGQKAKLAIAGMTAMAVAIGKIIDAYAELKSSSAVIDKHFEKQALVFDRYGKKGNFEDIKVVSSQKDYGRKSQIDAITKETNALKSQERAWAAIEKHFENERLADFFLDSHRQVVQPWEEATKTFKDLNTTISSTTNSFDLIGEHIDKNTTNFKKLADAIKDAELEEIVESIADSMESSITDAIMNIGQGVSSLKDMFKDLSRIVLREFVQIKVARPAANFLAGLTENIFKAEGGTVTGNQPYVVGEQGAEVFVPNKTGTIIPNNALSSSNTTENNVNISFNITANDTEGFDNLIESRRGMIVNLINQAMNDRGTLGVT
jgi:hypothetical protein